MGDQQGYGVNKQLNSLSRPPSLTHMQFSQVNQSFPSPYPLGGSFYGSFPVPTPQDSNPVQQPQAPSVVSPPQPSSAGPPPPGMYMSPQYPPSLTKYPSMGRMDSYQHLKLLVEEEVRKRKASGTFNFGSDGVAATPPQGTSTTKAGPAGSLVSKSSYLCMKSIIEDDEARKGITLPTKNSSQAIKNMLDEERTKAWHNTSFSDLLNFNKGLGATPVGDPNLYNHMQLQQQQFLQQQNHQQQLLRQQYSQSINPAAAAAARQVVNASMSTTKPATAARGGGKGKGANGADGKVRRTSAYRGVSFHTSSGNWRARIKVQGQSKHLGYFKNEHEAAKAYDDAAMQIYGANAPNNRSLRQRKLADLEGRKQEPSAAEAAMPRAKETSRAQPTVQPQQQQQHQVRQTHSNPHQTPVTTARQGLGRSSSLGNGDKDSVEAVSSWHEKSIDDLIQLKPEASPKQTRPAASGALGSTPLSTTASSAATTTTSTGVTTTAEKAAVEPANGKRKTENSFNGNTGGAAAFPEGNKTLAKKPRVQDDDSDSDDHSVEEVKNVTIPTNASEAWNL